MSRTAEEYRQILKAVFQMSMDDVYRELEQQDQRSAYLNGFYDGLREAVRKLDASAFLAE